VESVNWFVATKESILLAEWVLAEWVFESMYAAVVELANALSNFPVY
jgi:hypothetical protein